MRPQATDAAPGDGDGDGIDVDQVAASLRDLTKLGGSVEVVDALPNDGKVISDERDYDS
ncbi:MAG: phenylacetate--CoA ligase family protein, partial [Rhizobiaceae bacterium]